MKIEMSSIDLHILKKLVNNASLVAGSDIKIRDGFLTSHPFILSWHYGIGEGLNFTLEIKEDIDD